MAQSIRVVIYATLLASFVAACTEKPVGPDVVYQPRKDSEGGGQTPQQQEQAPSNGGVTAPTSVPDVYVPPPVVSTPAIEPEGEPVVVEDPANATPAPPGRPFGGGIGSNCGPSTGCGGAATVCFTEDYPQGMCSAPCSRYCADTSTSKTFCINDPSGEGGMCAAKCGSDSDCRSGYKCETRTRFNENQLSNKVCVPQTAPQSSCAEELARLIPYARSVNATTQSYAACGFSGTCMIDDPVELPDTIYGITFEDTTSPGSGYMKMSCRMAHALVRFAQYARAGKGTNGLESPIRTVRYDKLYACTGTADGDSVSAHGRGEAIDVTAMVTASGQTLSASSYNLLPSLDALELGTLMFNLRKEHAFNQIFTPSCGADRANLYANHLHMALGAGSSPVRDWMNGGGWQLDEQAITLERGSDGKWRDLVSSPGAEDCQLQSWEVCYAGF